MNVFHIKLEQPYIVFAKKDNIDPDIIRYMENHEKK